MVTEILKDLNRLDYLDSINIVNSNIIFKLQEAHRQRDSVDVQHSFIRVNQVAQIQLLIQKSEKLTVKSDLWEKRFKKQRRARIIGVGLVIGVVISEVIFDFF